jgi:hypothetical protein
MLQDGNAEVWSQTMAQAAESARQILSSISSGVDRFREATTSSFESFIADIDARFVDALVSGYVPVQSPATSYGPGPVRLRFELPRVENGAAVSGRAAAHDVSAAVSASIASAAELLRSLWQHAQRLVSLERGDVLEGGGDVVASSASAAVDAAARAAYAVSRVVPWMDAAARLSAASTPRADSPGAAAANCTCHFVVVVIVVVFIVVVVVFVVDGRRLRV